MFNARSADCGKAAALQKSRYDFCNDFFQGGAPYYNKQTMDINDIQFNKTDFDFVKTAQNTDEVLTKLEQNKVYGEILSVLSDGRVSMELRKRVILRAVDETWVNVIEDTLPALDEIVRHPARYLEENEMLLPIELTRKVTPRSIQHLSQHTGLISEVRDDDTIIPSKLMNVFRDETMNTYENRFINTLLSKLYTFVTMRYDIAEANMQDTKSTSLTVDESFVHGKAKGKIKLFIELEEPYDGEGVEKNYLKTTDLWRRIQRLYNVAKEYMASDFVTKMGKLYIRPPVMRTNAILKNKNMRQCLALWQFIETYTQAGSAYQITETLENVSPEYVRDLYSTLAVDYALFRYRTENGFDESETIAKYTSETPLTPQIVDELKPTTAEEYDYHYDVGVKMPCTQHELTEKDEDILKAISICLDAYDLKDFAVEEETEEEVVLKNGINRSFMAKLIQSSDTVQGYYTAIKNEFLSYKKVKSRISWNYDSFNRGRLKLGKLAIRGKTLVLFLNLDPMEFDVNKYHHKDASEVKKFAEVPFMLRIRSDRALKYALELIAILAEKFSLERGEAQTEDYRLPYESDYRLFLRELIKVYGEYVIEKDETITPLGTSEETSDETEEGAESEEIYVDASGKRFRLRKSFTAKLIQAQPPVPDYYGQLKNYLLSYNGVKSRVSWNYDSFNRGRIKLAKLNIRGKTLVIYLALDPNAFDVNKYHHKDVSDVNKYADVPFMLKVRSERALKYAKQLIDALMANFGIEKGAEQSEDYTLPFETTEALIEKGLIKAIGDIPAGGGEEKAVEKEVAAAESAELSPADETEEETAEEAAEEPTEATEEPIAEPEKEHEKELIPEDSEIADLVDTRVASENAKKIKFVRDDTPVVLSDKVPSKEELSPTEEEETEESPDDEKAEEVATTEGSTAETATAESSATTSEAFEAEEGGETDVYDAFSTSRYRRSFTAKMVDADEETIFYYTTIKNQLLRSKAVKWRISWGFDTFNIGRRKLARITVIGKTLVLYLDLDPAAYSESKYHHSDASNVAKVKDTPLMLKVRSERALKHALELVFDLYAKYELMINNLIETDWRFPKMTFEEMLEKGYIRAEGNTPTEVAPATDKVPDATDVPATEETLPTDTDTDTAATAEDGNSSEVSASSPTAYAQPEMPSGGKRNGKKYARMRARKRKAAKNKKNK